MKKSISFIFISCLFISMQPVMVQGMWEIVPKAPLELEEIEAQARKTLAPLVEASLMQLKIEKGKWWNYAEMGNAEGMQNLIAAGINVNQQKYPDNDTALMIAAGSGWTEVVRLLLNVPGIDVNIENYNAVTVLILAALNGRTEVVRLLLNVPGIDVNKQGIVGNTALIFAVESGNSAIVRELLNRGADWKIKNWDGQTAYDLADEKIKSIIREEVSKGREFIQKTLEEAFPSQEEKVTIDRALMPYFR